MEMNDAETTDAQPLESTTGMEWKSTEDPESDRYIDIFLSMANLAYKKERATKSSALIDSILKNTRFFVVLVVFLLCRYGNRISMYQVLFFVSLTPLFLYLYIKYLPFLLLEEDIKWIRRESRLLHAITRDAASVVHLRNHINSRTRQIFAPASRTYPHGVPTEVLNQAEAAWLARTESMVRRSKYLVELFERQRREPHRICFALMSTKNFMEIEGLFIETKLVKQEINKIILMMVSGRICESLERSRSYISLVDRPIYEHDQEKWVSFKGRVASAVELTSSIAGTINALITQKPALMRKSSRERMESIKLQMLLLRPFLKDIEGLRFESAIEEAWVEEVEEIIQEADVVINNFFHRAPTRISRWKARRRLKKDLKCIDAGFTELSERKERYGFKYIRRDSSKFVYQSPDDTTISSAMERMHGYLKEKSDVLAEVLYDVTSLCHKLQSMLKLLDDAGIIGSRYNSRMAWSEEMRNIVQRAEKCVQTFLDNSDILRRSIRQLRTRDGIKLSREIDRIQQTISLLVRSIKAYGIELKEESSSVVGLEEDIQELVWRLTSNSEQNSVISILGIGGIGKTTLAKKVYVHGAVMHHFPRKVWISLPCSNASWVQEVHDLIDEEKYLLVLDNLSTKEEWYTFKAGFPVIASGCRILFTTRHSYLASMSNTHHQLRLRTIEESWKLFIQMVHFSLKEEMLAKEIVDQCGGFPLAILRVGYLLPGKDVSTAQDLKRVLETIQNDAPLLQTYQKYSIKRLLPEHLFNCLSYLKLFPIDFEIPARRLIALWIAEGLIEESKETYEDVAEKYLAELIGQDMIQVVKRKINGEVKTCRLPYAIRICRLEEKVLDQRITLHFNRNGPRFLGESSKFPNHLLSVFSFGTREGYKPGEQIGNFLRKGVAGGFFRRLQVLDLERVFRPQLPEKIGDLTKLRYLGLRWTYLQLIPKSIGELGSLQTLDVKHTYVRTLPSSIWKLQKLRHLYLNQSYRSKFVYQGGGSSLKNLQTLWGVFVDTDSPLKDALDKLISLRKLGLAFQLNESEQKVLAERIVKLNQLKSLRMRSIGETGEPCDITWMPLSGLQNLSSLNLFGKLVAPSIVAEFPKNLTDLTLSASSLVNDPMLELEKLSNLKLLCLYSNSYTGTKMLCSAWGFPKLLVLKLWNLEQLEDWEVEEKAMQNLTELEIRSCTNLNVPTGLKHLKTLTEFKLTNMPQKFVAAIAETKAHSPAITAVNWHPKLNKS